MQEYSNAALGQVVRELREDKGITQAELGRSAGYGTGEGVSISRLENGLLRPSAEKLAGIAETLGLTVEELEAHVRERDVAYSTTESRNEDAKSSSLEAKAPPSQKELIARQARIQQRVHERSKHIQELGNAFNLHYERAFAEFFKRFDDIARRIEGAPPPDPLQLDDDPVATASDTADRWVQSNVDGVVRSLASSATGAAAGAVVGSRDCLRNLPRSSVIWDRINRCSDLRALRGCSHERGSCPSRRRDARHGGCWRRGRRRCSGWYCLRSRRRLRGRRSRPGTASQP